AEALDRVAEPGIDLRRQLAGGVNDTIDVRPEADTGESEIPVAAARDGEGRREAVHGDFLHTADLDAGHEIAREKLADGLAARNLDAVEAQGGLVGADADDGFRCVFKIEARWGLEDETDHRMNEAVAADETLRRVVTVDHAFYRGQETVAVAFRLR